MSSPLPAIGKHVEGYAGYVLGPEDILGFVRNDGLVYNSLIDPEPIGRVDGHKALYNDGTRMGEVRYYSKAERSVPED